MLKVLLLIALAWLAFVLLRQRKLQRPNPPQKPEDMVSCAICGTHVPSSEAISSQGQHYCCEAHFMQRKR